MKKEFIDAVVKEIKTLVGEECEVVCSEVPKNNGLVLHGISIKEKSSNISATIYLENYRKCDEDMNFGDYVHEVAKDIIERHLETKDVNFEFDLERIYDWDYIKNKVVIRLINYEMNKTLLEDTPHIKFLDLAIISHIDVNENASIRIREKDLKMLNISKEELFKKAKANTSLLYEVSGHNLFDVINGLIGEEQGKGLDTFTPVSMPYILTNTVKNFGANVILYDGVLEKLANDIDMDIVILPSSVHEVLLLPYDSNMDLEHMKSMVFDINRETVQLDEILSDSVYVYKKDKKQIVIA